MNLYETVVKAMESSYVPSRDVPDENQTGVSVEACEFEKLLQRAAEILSIRAQSATSSRP
jgi:hypothetical protein